MSAARPITDPAGFARAVLAQSLPDYGELYTAAKGLLGAVGQLHADAHHCERCTERCHWVDCPTGGWWSHEQHPGDGHDAVAGAPCRADACSYGHGDAR